MRERRRLCLGDPAYPDCFHELASPPKSVYVEGPLTWPEERIAVVGARAASGAMLERARAMSRQLAEAGVLLVSGGALGIDSAGHRGALDAGGATLAILGSGLDELYPARNRALFARILEVGGTLLSPFEPDAPPRRSHFVQRNWLIAAAAQLIWVVQARCASGSLHTARFGRRLRRLVVATPGSAGCDALIRRGVPAVRDAAEILELLRGGSVRQRPAPELAHADEELLRHFEAGHATPLEELWQRVGGAMRPLRGRLVALQLQGLLLMSGPDRYRLSPLAVRALAGDSWSKS